MASNIFGRPIQQETNQSYGVNRSNRARTTSYYATPDKTRQPQKKNTRFIRRRPQPQPKLSEPAPAIPSLHLDLVVYNQVADIIKGESNRKILYDLILADKSKTDKFLVDELVNELKTHKNSPITPSEAKRQLYALEKRILNRGGSPESSPDDAPPQSPVPKILTRSCPPQPLADPTLTEICESIYREDIDEIKKQKSTLTQMLGIGLIILLSSQEKSQHIQDVRTSLILNAIKKLPQKIVNGTISSSRMSRLRYHIEVLPSVACTLGEKKCYDLLKQSILFYENVIGEIPKESTESSQILDPSSQFLDPTSQFLNIPQHSLSPKSSNRSFRSGRSGLTQQSFTSSSMFQDYNDRGEMYQEIPLYLTGTTTVRRQPRLDMYSRTQAFINVRQNEDGSYPSMGLSSMRSAGTSGGLCESPNQKFIRMRQNRQGKTVVLDNTHSKSFRNFKEKVDNSVSQEPVYRILTPDLWDFQGSREDLHSMRGIKQMGQQIILNMESPINIFNINQEKPKKRKRVSATLNKAGKAITAVTNRLHQPSNIRQKLLGRQISEARTKQIDLDIEAMQKQFEATKQKSEYLSTLRTQRTNEKNNWKAVANHRELELQEKREKVIEQRYLHYDRLRLNTDRIINENLLAANETHLKTIQNRERKNKEKNEFLANVRIRRAMSKDFVKEIWFDKPTNYDGTTRERRVLQAYGIPKKVNSIK